MTTAPPLLPATSEPRKTFFHRAATFSLWAPLIGIVVSLGLNVGQLGHPPQTRMEALTNGILHGFVPIMGFLAGGVALFGIPRYGRAGILWKALIGMLIFLLMIAATIPALLKAREKARSRYEMRYDLRPN